MFWSSGFHAFRMNSLTSRRDKHLSLQRLSIPEKYLLRSRHIPSHNSHAMTCNLNAAFSYRCPYSKLFSSKAACAQATSAPSKFCTILSWRRRMDVLGHTVQEQSFDLKFASLKTNCFFTSSFKFVFSGTTGWLGTIECSYRSTQFRTFLK